MFRLTMVLSGVAVLVAGVYQPVHANAQTKAKTYYVGTCKPGKADYTTIQEAVTGVPAGSTIDVCAGTYPEQVTILQPLTLQGALNGNNAAVVITAPAGGALAPTVPVALPVAAQLAVSNSGGPVNITGITVDGTGVTGSTSGSGVLGVLYNSSPGTLNRVVLQNLAPPNIGAEEVEFRDDSAVSPTDTIENSVISMPSSAFEMGGIAADTVITGFSPGHPPVSSAGTLTANILNNYITGGPGSEDAAIDVELNVAATITGNTIAAAATPAQTASTNAFGEAIVVFEASAPIKMNGNTVTDADFGITLAGSTSTINIANNVLASSKAGIFVTDPSVATITGNQFVPASLQVAGSGIPAGIDFGCIAPPTVSGNTFIGTAVALANVPSGTSLQKNAGNFVNVPTVEQLCP
jgi:parallel beta-helix repeat protein